MELTKELLAEWISRFYEKIQNNKGYLSDLDAAIGDGDHGNNMARGCQVSWQPVHIVDMPPKAREY